MVNQWGRDGNLAPSSSRSSGGGVIVAALVALMIGGGGGYAGARFFSGISASDVSSRDKKISELQQQLSDIKFSSDGASSEQKSLRERITELESQVDSLERTKESLRKYAEEQASKATGDAQAEIDALNKTIEEAGQVADQLAKAKRSLKVSELQIIELEKAAREQDSQIEKLQTALNDRAEQGDAGLKALNDQVKVLQSALSAAKRENGAIPDLKAQIQELRDQLSSRVDEADAEARKQIDALKRDKASLQKQLDAALKDASGSDELDALTAQIDTMQRSLNQKDRVVSGQQDEIASLGSALEKAKADVAKASSAMQKMKSGNDALNKDIKKLRDEVANQNALIDKLSKQAKPVQEDLLPPPDDKPDVSKNEPEPRRARDVANALENMPGFDNLSDARKAKLRDGLERGGCVTGPLKSALGRVPPVSLIYLMRELESSC